MSIHQNMSLPNTIQLGKNKEISISTKGAFINEFWIRLQDGKRNLIKGFANPHELEEQLLRSYNGARLAPFPNRIADGKYSFEGIDYQLPINFPHGGHAIHGFVAGMDYEVLESTWNQVSLLADYLGEKNAYPFLFRSKVSFILEGNRLTCVSEVTNMGTGNMPYAEGWHPYFQLGGKVDDWELSFPAKAQIAVNDRMIPTGQTSVYQQFNEPKLIENQAFDTCFELQEANRAITVVKHQSDGFQLKVFQEMGMGQYNFLQLYIPEDRTSLAIEPMTCVPDVFNNGKGLIILQPNETIQLKWGMEVEML
ncbi:MAG: aldose 1-epimerase [Flammeovirgaceae bacterium]